MSRLADEIRKIKAANRDIAGLACHIGDLPLADFTPHIAHQHQDWVRRQRLWTEHRLRTVRARNTLRKKRLKRFTGPSRGIVNQVFAERQRQLEIQVRILQQIGDTIAWRVLRGDARLFAALYAPRPHHLPLGTGIGGPILVARKPRESGEFYVIENDLTRVLGQGDLTAVWANREWSRPLYLEVKTRGEWVEGGTAELFVSAIEIDSPVDREMYAQYCQIAGLDDPPPEIAFRPNDHQIEGMLVGGEVMLRVTEQRTPDLPAATSRVWRTIDNVLVRALRDGASYDLIERGLGVAAVRATDGAESISRSTETIERLRDLGLSENVGSAPDFLTTAPWSALAAPIPMWLLPRRVRAALLVEDLFGIVVATPSLWRDALRDEGLEVERRGKGWLLRGTQGSRFLDMVDVLRLTLGVAFSGISPRAAAHELARSLNRAPERTRQESDAKRKL